MKSRLHALLRGTCLALLASMALQAQNATTPDDHGNTYSAATSTTLPGTKTGSLGSPGDIDFFKFTLNAPAVVTVTSGGTTDVVGRLWLGSSKGTPTEIYADNDGAGVPNFRLSQQLPAGTHYVSVNAAVYGTLGNYTVNFAVAAPSAQQPDISVGLDGANLPSGTLVDFGTASLAQTVTRDFMIGNAGNADLVIRSLRIVATSSLPTGVVNPFRLTTLPLMVMQPGRQSFMRVTFQASVAATYNAKAVITTNDGYEIFYDIPMRAVAGGALPVPEIAVRDNTTEVANNGTFSVGSTMVNTRLLKLVTIANTGAGELKISNVAMVPVGATSSSITIYNSVVPASIPAGGQASFQVSLLNLVAGTYTSRLTFTTNDADENPTAIHFTGTVNPDPVQGEIGVSTSGSDVPTGSTVSYGNQFTGTSTTKDFLISNTGTGELRITSWSLSTPPPATISVSTTTTTGSPTATVTSAANLAPGMAVSGPFPSGTMIASIAGNAVTFSAAATSTVLNANLVYYIGGTATTVQAFRVEGAVPVSVPAGGSATVKIAYQPLQTGDHAAIFRAYNNDANENPFVINLSGHADANPNPGDIALSLSGGDVALNSTVDWGDAPVNTMTTKTFTITNSGTGDLRLTGFFCSPVQPAVSTTTPTYFLYGSIPSTTTPLAPGGTATFSMIFRPSAAGTVYKATMTLASTDPDEGLFKVNLQGTGAVNTNPVPDIEISVNGGVVASGGTFAFGNSNSGVLNQKSLTIRNAGASSLTVTAVLAGLPVGSPAGASNPWSVVASPMTLAAGGSLGGYVNFAPTIAGNYTGVLQISSNDPDESPYLVNLTGTGVGTVAAPELNLALAGVDVPMGGLVPYGETTAGTPVSKTFTLTNSGDAPLTLSFFTFEQPAGATVGATITTTIGSPTATLGTAFGTLVPGMTVSGPFPVNTTLVSISGSILTFSAPAITASSTSVTFFQPGVPIANPFRYDGTLPTSIAPGASANFTLTYAPLTAGTHSMVARFGSNDISESLYRFNVTGSATGTAPAPEVGVTVAGVNAPAGSTVAYGTTTPGSVVSKQFVISNTGTAALNLTGWSMIHPAPAIYASGASTLGSSSMSLNSTISLTPGMVVVGPFPAGTTLQSVSGNTAIFSAQATSTSVGASLTFYPAGTNTVNYFQFSGALPTTIAAGASATVTVNYAPSTNAVGNHSMLMRFTNNDSDENPYQLVLTGTSEGTPSAPEVALSVAGTALPQFGNIAYGSTAAGTPVSKQITIANTGGLTLNLSNFGFFLTATGTSLPTTTMTGSAVATVTSTSGLSVGMSVSGPGIVAGTTILSINSATSITLSTAPMMMLVGGSVTYYPAGTSTINPFSIVGTVPASVAPGGSVVLTVNYSPTAVGSHSMFLRFNTNDADENPVNVTLTGTATTATTTPEISVFIGTVEQARGSSIDFGTIARGTTATKDFIVKNTGTANLSVTNVISTLAPSGLTTPAFTVTLLSGSSSIVPGGSATFRATFKPMAKTTSYSATYNINNNDTDENPYGFTLTGASNALDSEIAVTFDGADMPHNGTIAFGSGITVGTIVSKSLTITNSGDGPLTISGYGFSSSTSTTGNLGAPYTLTGVVFTVAPGASATFTANYRPITASASDSWALTINNSDADEAAYKINFTGSSIASTTPPEVALSVDGTDIATGGSLALSTAVNVALTKDVVIRNTGTDALIIASSFVSNTSGTTFSLTQSAPTSIPAGGTGIVKVRFLPTAAGSSFAGKITVNNSDPDETSYVINLTGATAP